MNDNEFTDDFERTNTSLGANWKTEEGKANWVRVEQPKSGVVTRTMVYSEALPLDALLEAAKKMGAKTGDKVEGTYNVVDGQYTLDTVSVHVSPAPTQHRYQGIGMKADGALDSVSDLDGWIAP